MALSKAKYDDRKAKGLCVQCGAKANGRIRCDTCLEANKAIRQVRRTERKEAGQCTECSDPVKSGGTMCPGCSGIRTKAASKRYEKNKANNVCRGCGKESGGESRCPGCKKRFNDWRKKKRQKG